MSTSTKVRPPVTPLCRDGNVYQMTGHPGRGKGHRELWGAVSSNRVWRYRREDARGTPWSVDRWNFGAKAYVQVAAGFESLHAARVATADEAWWKRVAADLAGQAAPQPAPAEVAPPQKWRIV